MPATKPTRSAADVVTENADDGMLKTCQINHHVPRPGHGRMFRVVNEYGQLDAIHEGEGLTLETVVRFIAPQFEGPEEAAYDLAVVHERRVVAVVRGNEGRTGCRVVPAGDAPPPAVPALEPADPLARLATRYWDLTARALAINAEVDRLLDAGRKGEGVAMEGGPMEAALEALDVTELALRRAMTYRDVPAITVDGRLFVNTCCEAPYLPDRPRWIYPFDAPVPAEGQPNEDLPPAWLFTGDDLVSSDDLDPLVPYDTRPLRLEFELTGQQAAAARAWLTRKTTPVDEDV